MQAKKISYRANRGRLKSCPSKFCARCLFPSDDRKAELCAVCGSEGGFIGFYERVKRDRFLPDKWKCTRAGDALALIFSAVITSIFCAVRLFDFSQKGVLGDEGGFLFPVLILQFIPVVGAVYILLKGERLLDWLFLLALPVITLAMLSSRDIFLCLLSSLYLLGFLNFLRCAHHVEFYEPYNETTSVPDILRGQWKCAYCGYINGTESVECKSCGRK